MSVQMSSSIETLALDQRTVMIGRSTLVHADCFKWLAEMPDNSIHAVITDPPYGIKEYDVEQLEKRASGNGGIWRIPPSFDGHIRSPLPRFTALDDRDIVRMEEFFTDWGESVLRVLRPGGHLFIACNAIMANLVFNSLTDCGLEFRGQIIRLVRTLRGGDRPKNAEKEFADVISMPRGCYEPWGLFRKPLLPKMRVSDCLREFQTGGLRRCTDDKPFADVIPSERTPQRERRIAPHPSLKPQSFLRKLTYSALPLGEGLIADPFMGSGSTIAAAEAVGASAIGVERLEEYFNMAVEAIPKLTALNIIEPFPREEDICADQITLFK